MISCRSIYATHQVLLLGQFISVLITCTGIFTQILNQSYEIQIPVTQSAGNYLLLCMYLVYPVWQATRNADYKLEIAWWKYLLLALADVEGNFLVVCAYKYTSIASAMLLDCFTIPVVMLLSAIFLQAKYTPNHYAAVLLCLLGITLLVYSDLENQPHIGAANDTSLPSKIYGDALCLLGSAIYGCSNVGQEYLVKKKDRRVEFLGMIGLFGFLVSSIQAAVFEEHILAGIHWTDGSAACLAGYVVTLFIMYTSTSIFLQSGDAAVFNLSLLTSDFFAVVAAKFLFNEELTSLYFVGFVLIILGIGLYNNVPTVQAVESEEVTTQLLVKT